jgi:hypothetical protein
MANASTLLVSCPPGLLRRYIHIEVETRRFLLTVHTESRGCRLSGLVVRALMRRVRVAGTYPAAQSPDLPLGARALELTGERPALCDATRCAASARSSRARIRRRRAPCPLPGARRLERSRPSPRAPLWAPARREPRAPLYAAGQFFAATHAFAGRGPPPPEPGEPAERKAAHRRPSPAQQSSLRRRSCARPRTAPDRHLLLPIASRPHARDGWRGRPSIRHRGSRSRGRLCRSRQRACQGLSKSLIAGTSWRSQPCLPRRGPSLHARHSAR